MKKYFWIGMAISLSIFSIPVSLCLYMETYHKEMMWIAGPILFAATLITIVISIRIAGWAADKDFPRK